MRYCKVFEQLGFLNHHFSKFLQDIVFIRVRSFRNNLARCMSAVMFCAVAGSPSTLFAQSNAVCGVEKVYDAARNFVYQAPVDLDIRGISVRIPERLAANPNIGRWGDTRADNDGSIRFHAGVDLLGDVGEAIVAPISGTIDSGRVDGLGRYIDLNFDVPVLNPPATCPVHFRFAHLSEITVASGAVSAGQTIGKIGRDGNANASSIPTHLHIEFWAIPQTRPGQDRQASTRDPTKLFGW